MIFLAAQTHPQDASHADEVPFADVPIGQNLDSVPQTPHIIDTVSQANDTVTTMLGVVPIEHGLILATILFVIGLCGVMVRRNLLFMLMSLEIMMNAAALAFVVAGSRWLDPDGQIMFIFILTLAAAEAAIGLAILLQFYHRQGHLDVDAANEMRG